jgi:hypothetical protein
LDVGSFAQYKQEFSTGETHELRWEITSLAEQIIEIEVQSHGLVFNSTDDSFDVVPGGGLLVINKTSLHIITTYLPNGTEISGYPVGEKIAFWIPAETDESTPLNSMYESDEYPTSVGPLQFDCVPTSRMCWKTENYYSFGNGMNRYYDQETGVVLMIETNRTLSSAIVSVMETLNETNIAPLLDGETGISFETLLLTGSIAVVLLITLVLYFMKRR